MEEIKRTDLKSMPALTFTYDEVGDILYIDSVKRYAEQDSDEIHDGIVARFNPHTGKVENLEILFFAHGLFQNSEFNISRLSDLFSAAPATSSITPSAKPHPR